MSTKTFSDAELDLLHEGWHLPHMQRELAPVVIVNQHQSTVWHPRRLDLALATVQDDSAAQEGGAFREPAPVRVPRNRPFFKTATQMRAEGWEPANWRETLIALGTPAAIFAAVIALWAFMTWGA